LSKDNHEIINPIRHEPISEHIGNSGFASKITKYKKRRQCKERDSARLYNIINSSRAPQTCVLFSAAVAAAASRQPAPFKLSWLYGERKPLQV